MLFINLNFLIMRSLLSKIAVIAGLVCMSFVFSSYVNSSDICTQPGYVRDPNDCSVYYLCEFVDGSFVNMRYECPISFCFNPVIAACDFCANVSDCDGTGGGSTGGDIQGILCEYPKKVSPGEAYTSCGGSIINGQHVECGTVIYNEKGKNQSKCFK